MTALEPGTLLTWHRDRVKFCLMEEPRLQAIFDHVVARDVVRKLMQVRGTFAVKTSAVKRSIISTTGCTITEKALVGAFSVITNLRMQFGCNFLKH